MIDKKEVKEIKTFLAKEKPKEFEVFQFTKEMLPEIDSKRFGYKDSNGDYSNTYSYRADFKFNSNIFFWVYRKEIECFIKVTEPGIIADKFEVRDYIGEDKKGDYFVIKKEDFEKDWVVVK